MSQCGCGCLSAEERELLYKIEEQQDAAFIQRVVSEVQVSCALPIQIPMKTIEGYIYQAAQWFWEMDNACSEERSYVIYNKDICKKSPLNKIIILPEKIISIHGVFKTNNKYGGVMGDFSVERLMMNNYTFGVGSMSSTMNGGTDFQLTDVVASMYELDTYASILDTPLTYDYNRNSNKLVLLGDLGYSDLVINTFQRCKIQDLYNYYWFFRRVVALVKRGLSTIYGSFEFTLPGGVTINYDKFKTEADEELEEIMEYVKSQYSSDFIFMSCNN